MECCDSQRRIVSPPPGNLVLNGISPAENSWILSLAYLFFGMYLAILFLRDLLSPVGFKRRAGKSSQCRILRWSLKLLLSGIFCSCRESHKAKTNTSTDWSTFYTFPCMSQSECNSRVLLSPDCFLEDTAYFQAVLPAYIFDAPLIFPFSSLGVRLFRNFSSSFSTKNQRRLPLTPLCAAGLTYFGGA